MPFGSGTTGRCADVDRLTKKALADIIDEGLREDG
jgi:hypothetical protein